MRNYLALALFGVLAVGAGSAFGWDFEYDADVDPYELVATSAEWELGDTDSAGEDYDSIVPSAEAQTGNAILDRNDDNSAADARFMGIRFATAACDAEWSATLNATLVIRAKNLETDYNGAALNEKGKALLDIRDGSSNRWNLSQTDEDEWVLDCFNDRGGSRTDLDPMLVTEADDWHVIRIVITSDGSSTTYTTYYDEEPTPIHTVTHAETIAQLRFEFSRSSGGNAQHWQIDWIRAEIGEAWSPTEGDLVPGAGTTAKAGPDQRVYATDEVTLDGRASTQASTWDWTQTEGTPTVTLNPTADPEVVTFTAPDLTVGTVLTFELKVTGETGESTDTVTITILARNAPRVAPGNVRLKPVDKGFRLFWEPVLDADAYDVMLEIQPDVWFQYGTGITETEFPVGNQTPGDSFGVKVVAKNSFCTPEDPGAESDPLYYTIMRNLSLPAPGGDTPPLPALEGVTYVISHYDINRMNNKIYNDNNDSWFNDEPKDEDFWGYLWGEDLFFNHIVYYEGENFGNGGWWTYLTVEFTTDGGTTWIPAPEVTIDPAYNFTDSRSGRQAFSRFDISFKPVRGNGIRLCGVPGGSSDFTSVAELEVYGDQDQGPLVVYGVDASFDERTVAVLDGSYSFSTRGALSGFSWEQTGVPTVEIADPLQARTTFAAPAVDADTVLTFQFTAGDGVDVATDDVYITIKNLKTTAVAAAAVQSTVEGSEVPLDGTGSVTTSGTLTYSWTQIDDGPKGTLQDANTATPTFIAPFVYRFTQDSLIELQVDDGLGNPDSVSTDTVTITVTDRHGALIVLEAENYTATADNGDIRSWSMVEGDPTYMTTDPAPDENAEWANGCELSYDITIPSTGAYTLLLRRYADDGGTNSCRAGADGNVAINDFDNAENYAVWVWMTQPGQYITFDTPGDHTLDIRRREGGYHIDKIILYGGQPAGVPAEGSTEVGPPEGNWAGPIFCDRTLSTYYTAGTPFDVDLTFDVNMETPPATLIVTENLPAGFAVASAEGDPDLSTPGKIVWTLTGGDVANRSLTYTLDVPPAASGPAEFTGGMTYGSVFNQPIGGQSVVYAIPPAPPNLDLEMLLGAHLSWSPNPPEDGVVGYHVYRSVNGSAYQEITTAPLTGTSYVDADVQEGSFYQYKVTSESASGAEGPLALSHATDSKQITMEIRQCEDFNYGGGQWPGDENCPAAIEAPSSDQVGTPAEYDFFFFNDYAVGDPARAYRPNDNVRTAVRDTTRYIGSTTAGDWWRYTFDVPDPGPGDPEGGWVKLTFRVSCPDESTFAVYWDEELVGTVTFVTGDFATFEYIPMEDQFQSDTGEHTLRLTLAAGEANPDKIGIGFNWTPPKRQPIFEDHFDAYTTNQDVLNAGWEVINGSGEPLGAWQLWNTAGDPLGEEDPDLPGMTDGYMISDSDMAGWVMMDEELISPEIDCTGWVKLRLDFSKNYTAYVGDVDYLQVADVDIQSFDEVTGWSDWVNLLQFNRTTVPQDVDPSTDSDPEQLDLAAYDGMKIKLRWHHYDSYYDYWFAIDDVVLTGEQLAPEEGVITGLPVADGKLGLVWNPFGDGNYTVQYRDSLTSGDWQPVPGFTWPTQDTTWPGEDMAGIPARYYRVTAQ